MRKMIVAGFVAALMAGGVGAAVAAPGDHGNAGPNDHNLFGLCTAYGHIPDQAQGAPPFAALAQAASDAGQSVADYCASATPGDSGK